MGVRAGRALPVAEQAGLSADNARPLPDFVIIGAQKAGSTGLMRHLAAHPHLYLPDHETRYFRDPWFQFQSPSVLADDVEPAGPGVRRRGIKCPDYLALPEGPQRISAALGEVHLIAVLREPVDRAISSYFWAMQWGLVPLEAPEEGLRKILDGEWAKAHPRSTEVLEYGLYGKHLTRYLDVFRRERIAVLIDEELRSAPLQAMRTRVRVPRCRCHRGAAVEPASRERRRVLADSAEVPLPYDTSTSCASTRAIREGTSKRPSTLRSRIADRSIAAVDRLVLSRIIDNTKPTVSDALRARLADYYRTDVELTARVIDRDLSGWLRHERTGG